VLGGAGGVPGGAGGALPVGGASPGAGVCPSGGAGGGVGYPPGAGARPWPSGRCGKCSRGSSDCFPSLCSGKLSGGCGLWSAGRAGSSLMIPSGSGGKALPYFITSGDRPRS